VNRMWIGIIVATALVLSAACGPSDSDIQSTVTAIVGEAIAEIPTVVPTATAVPSPTPQPTATPQRTTTLAAVMDMEELDALLSVDDINLVAGGGLTLIVEFRDGRAMAAGVDPSQVTEIESWYIADFQSVNPLRGVTFSVMDFVSSQAAQNHFDKVLGETPGLVFHDPPIGDTSVKAVFNGQGLGSIIMYRTGDRFVSLHTSQPFDVEPIMPVEGLETLAQLVLTRMQ
jgi:hypothetical protein